MGSQERKGAALPLGFLGVVWAFALLVWGLALVDFGGGLFSDLSQNLKTYCFGWDADAGPQIGRTLVMALVPVVLSLVAVVGWRRELFGSRGPVVALGLMGILTTAGFLTLFTVNNVQANAGEPYRTPRERTAAPDFALVDQDGETFALSEAKGKVVCITFFYTHCMSTCPVQVKKLLAVQDRFRARLGGELLIVPMSIDPIRDDRHALQQFALRKGCKPGGWKFLSGPRNEVKEILNAYQVVHGIPEEIGRTTQIGHSALIVLIDREGRRAYDFYGTRFADEKLTDKVGELLAEH